MPKLNLKEFLGPILNFKMINLRIKVDYDDQNESFAKFLPRNGQIIQRLTDEYGNSDWLLVKLDEFFEYQLKTGDNFQFRLIKCDQFLIRSRWKNQRVDSEEGTSVFIMLIPNEEKLLNIPIRIDDYVHIAWGYAKLICGE